MTTRGVNPKEFWDWFDLMPRHVRDQINNAPTPEMTTFLWNRAMSEHGNEVRAKLQGRLLNENFV